ncbi:MAG: sigma-70 family RNA polymerase sigma factor [Chloroflexi bacterium]|nr:sigma-70 family RNA polymerase sigma factor [Chloroflexota bacterium]
MSISVPYESSAAINNAVLAEIDIEEMLERFDPFITSQVKELVRQNPNIAHAAVRDLETDELIQRVRIKFWNVLKNRQVEYSKAYIRRIIHSEFVDMLRRKRPMQSLPLPIDEEGELYQGAMLITPGQGMSDPEYEYEEEVELTICMDEMVDAVLQLPARQQQAMVCSLRDRVDDLTRLEDAFDTRQVDMSMLQWPTKKAEKQILQASLSAARTHLVKSLKDRDLYRKALSRLKKAKALTLA